MKKKITRKVVIILSIIIFILSGSVVYAAILFDSSNVDYNNANSGLSSSKVQDAIDELDSLIPAASDPTENPCTSNFNCTSTAPKCKRVTSASSLHTETCQQSSNYCAAVEGNGNTITYGRAKSLGTPLEPGDAFDCKVSTTGTYSERFYYVSDYYDTTTKSFNSDVGVLIYSNNTVNGSASPSAAAYDSSNENWHGPQTAVTHLPSTDTWNNISLYKTERQILTQNNYTSTSGGTLPTAFSYSGKAARLLTYQEVYQACYNTTTAITSNGGLSNCNFLFEKTKYSVSSNPTSGPWLETPYVSNSSRVYNATSGTRYVEYSTASNASRGVRPTIEVLKSDISY